MISFSWRDRNERYVQKSSSQFRVYQNFKQKYDNIYGTDIGQPRHLQFPKKHILRNAE
jgi:hypothetical protein